MVSDKIVIVTKENFEEEVINSDKLVVVDFWAPWCGPCRAVGPIMDELAAEYDGTTKICKVNVDEQGELAVKYRIMSIPTVMVFKGGQIVEKLIGARTKKEFSETIDKNI